jgi:preprotein translocase SecE subunit
MARQTRQQRRQRRAQQQPAAAGPPLRPPARPVREEEPRPEPRRQERREERPDRGIPGVRFVQEAIAELKKVEWPNPPAVISGTAVVLIACLIVGAFLWLNDELWKYVVHHVLLR